MSNSGSNRRGSASRNSADDHRGLMKQQTIINSLTAGDPNDSGRKIHQRSSNSSFNSTGREPPRVKFFASNQQPATNSSSSSSSNNNNNNSSSGSSSSNNSNNNNDSSFSVSVTATKLTGPEELPSTTLPLLPSFSTTTSTTTTTIEDDGKENSNGSRRRSPIVRSIKLQLSPASSLPVTAAAKKAGAEKSAAAPINKQLNVHTAGLNTADEAGTNIGPLTTVSLQGHISLMDGIRDRENEQNSGPHHVSFLSPNNAALTSPLTAAKLSAQSDGIGCVGINRRKPHRPRRAIPVPESFLDRINHKIIQLHFPSVEKHQSEYYYGDLNRHDSNDDNDDADVDEGNSKDPQESFETYLSSLLSFYRSKPRIHRLRMRRRHDRIISRASRKIAAKDSHMRISRRLQHSTTDNLTAAQQQIPSDGRYEAYDWADDGNFPSEDYFEDNNNNNNNNDDDGDNNVDSDDNEQPYQATMRQKHKRGRPRKQQQRIKASESAAIMEPDHDFSRFLDDEEHELCHSLALPPEEYLHAKQVFKEALETQGPFRKTASRRLVPHLEIPVISKLYDYFVRINWITKV